MNILTSFAVELSADELSVPKLTGEEVLANGLGVAYFVAGTIAVIAIIIAGITMASNGGDPATVTKAKNTIVYSAIGLVVIIAAFFITQFVIGRF